jgi:hypothetical protein
MDQQHVLWVYEKSKTAPRASTPRKEGHRENYYTFTDRGFPDDSPEKILSKAESMVAPTIKRLRNPLFTMGDAERRELYSFVALMFVRVPAYRDFVDAQAGRMMKRLSQDIARNRERFYESVRAYETETGESVTDPEGLRTFAAGENYSVTRQSTGFNLLQAFQSFFTISEILDREYRHDVYYAAAGSHFITCDNPIITIEPDSDGRAWVGTGFGRPNTEVLFPLNKRACLILSRRGTGRSMT